MTRSARDGQKSQKPRIHYSRDGYDEGGTYAARGEADCYDPGKAPRFTRMCADGSELVMLHQEAFAADYKKTSTFCLG
jgi:hypothetical protein